MMNGREKSDSAIVAMKPANNVGNPAAEWVERRAGTKGNTGQSNTCRAQNRASVPQGLERVRQAAWQRKKERFTALLHHVTIDRLRESFHALKRNAAPGMDGMTWRYFEANLEGNLQRLHAQVQSGAYRALPVRRQYIPKPDGKQRPLGIAALEDKVVQRAVVEVLNAIYEADFLGFSYGFRPGRSQHDAMDALSVAIDRTPVNWIAPHAVIDLQKTPVDGINFAPYKFFGCRGAGVAWMSERLAELPHHRLAAKEKGVWELGSPAPAQFAVVSAIVDYVAWIGAQFSDAEDRRELFVQGMQRIEDHERALLSLLLDGVDGQRGLRAIEGVHVFWDLDDLTRRDLIAGLGFDGLDPTAAVRAYEERGVIVYERIATSLYSGRMLKSFNLEGAVRISPLHCHASGDVARFLTVTEDIARARSVAG